MERHEIVIVGAGPGGLRAAEILAGRGMDILILERKRSVGDKICADGLSQNAIKLNYVPKEFYEREFMEIKLRMPNVILNLRGISPLVITFDRKKFCGWQKDNTEDKGGEIRLNSRVMDVNPDDAYLTTDKGEKIGYDILIGADGSYSTVRRALGLKNRYIFSYQYRHPRELEDLEWGKDPKNVGAIGCYVFPHNGYTTLGLGWIPRKYGGIKKPDKDRFKSYWKGRGLVLEEDTELFRRHTSIHPQISMNQGIPSGLA